jgi:hypothetical protein
MKKYEEQQADEMDLYLEALQSGRPVPPIPSLAAAETELLCKLVEIQQATQPNPVVADVLEKRLQRTASTLTRKRKSHPYLTGLSGLQKGITSMKTIINYTLAGAGALAVIILAFVVLRHQPGSLPIAQISTQTTTILTTPLPPTSTPEMALATPTGPSSPAFSPTAIQIIVPTTPTQVLPAAVPSLPVLAVWLGSGYGGGGFSPGRFQFGLSTSLSNDASQATAYLQREPIPLNIQQTASLVADFGLDQPQWYDNVAVQEPRQVVFENNNSFDYIDHSVFNFPSGRYYYPPESYPRADLAATNAQTFLNSAGLLSEPYTYTVRGEHVFFYRVLEGQRTVYESFAWLTIGPDGRVGMAHVSQPGLDEIGVYPLISPKQAWQILINAQQNPADASRIYIQVRSTVSGNPRIWTRTYQADQQAEIYSPLTILQPSEADKPLYIRTSNGLLVHDAADSLQSLARDYRALVESSMDQAKAIHIWGAIQDEDGFQVLELAGWDSQSYDYLWQGTLKRKDDLSVLRVADGSTLPLAGLPVEVPDGQRVFVEGFNKDGTLEWNVIQDYVENPPSGQEVNQLVSINKVELAYLAPQYTRLEQTMTDSVAVRTLQPVWCFSGQVANGDLIQVFVQAIEPTMIDK